MSLSDYGGQLIDLAEDKVYDLDERAAQRCSRRCGDPGRVQAEINKLSYCLRAAAGGPLVRGYPLGYIRSLLMAGETAYGAPRSTSLVDLLNRVLDKGLVVAGDIRVSLAEVELLTIRIRLLICSLDKAEQMGIDWWKYDRYFSTRAPRPAMKAAPDDLRRQIRVLEGKIEALERGRRTRK